MNVIQEHLYVYNSMQRRKAKFKTVVKNEVKMYVCGMTVYDLCHIGHARVIIFFDFVARYLEAIGYKVNYIRNITDVDDKIIKKSQAENTSCNAITTKFIAALHEDAKKLGNKEPTAEPKATAYITEMIAMISTLIEKGFAYKSESGDICYAIAKFKNYGKLSRRDLSSLVAGSRVDADHGKENKLDFVLWKLAKPGEPSWDSPWGAGRPGWHIECSAMSTCLLGSTLDIHGGGVDLQFPHHENEIAQSEGATGKNFVNNWIHVGSVQINNEKMSKSLGNFYTIREVLEDYDAETIRYFMLSSHYRHPIQFEKTKLLQAKRSVERVYLALRIAGPNLKADLTASEYKDFLLDLADDFNTPKALSRIAEQVKKINLARDKDDSVLARQLAQALLAMGSVLGLFSQDSELYFQSDVDAADFAVIDDLVKERQAARLAKDWQRADAIRDQLLNEYRVELEDTDSGCKWRHI